MKIAVVGAGAMGSIYGGHLSQHNEVYMVDTAAPIVDQINAAGLKIEENDTENIYHPKAVTTTEGLEPVDLIILFVKSLFSRAALSGNKGIIGPDTYVMTLQNGSGHEDLIREFVPEDHIIIGTTNDNGAVLGPAHVKHGGVGETNIGMLTEDTNGFLPRLKETFDACGFQTTVSDNIQQLIWDKLFTNVSLSAVTGILQVDMGYIAGNEHAWNMTVRLINEAAAVARGLGLKADDEAIIAKVKKTSEMSPNGCTSIRADLRDGRKTEVDTISGSVVRASKKCGVPAPSHEFLVEMVHALEEKQK